MILGISLFLASSCKKENAAISETNMVRINFGACIEATKVSIEPNSDASVFAQNWNANDIISFTYSNGTLEESVSAVWDDTDKAFSFYISEEKYLSLRNQKYNWTYKAEYIHSDWPKTCSQNGNGYSDGRDFIVGSQNTSGTLFGDGISITMQRKTAVLYFDISSAGISEPVTRAVLRIAAGETLAAEKVELDGNETLVAKAGTEKYNETILQMADGTSLSDGIRLWFNTLPTENVSEMSLDLETSSHMVSISRKSTGSAFDLAANTITMIKKADADGCSKLLFETFSGSTQKGGNDGIWDGSNPQISAISADLSWEFQYSVAANSCIRVGSSQNGAGYAQSPSFVIPEGKTATVTLRAGAVTGDNNKLKLRIFNHQGDEVFSSVQELSEAAFCTKAVALSGVSGSCKLRIEGLAAEGKTSRFYLDDIKVTY